MKTDTKILNKVLLRFYNKHIDSGALWRRRESEVEKGLGGAQGLSVSTGSVNFPPGPRPPAHSLQPSPCEWSISSPCGPERLCVHRQELVQEHSKDLSNQLLSEDVPGHACPGRSCRCPRQQGISPLQLGKQADSPSRKPSGTADSQPLCPSALGSWVLTISRFKPFPFPGSPKSWFYEVQNHCWFSGCGGGNAPSHLSHTVFLRFPGQPWVRGPGAFLLGWQHLIRHHGRGSACISGTSRPVSQTQGWEDSGSFHQCPFPPPWQLDIPWEAGVTEAEMHLPCVGARLLLSLPQKPLAVSWVPSKSHPLCPDFLVPAQVSRMTWQADPCSRLALPVSGTVPAVSSPRTVFSQCPHSSSILTGLPRPLVWNNP